MDSTTQVLEKDDLHAGGQVTITVELERDPDVSDTCQIIIIIISIISLSYPPG